MPTVPFLHRHRVTYSECTVGNHVYYARYLDLLEAARGEWLRSLGWPLSELNLQNITFPVTEARLIYQAPARYDEVIAIGLQLGLLTRLRLEVEFSITNETGKPLVTGSTHHVCATAEDKPRRMPVELLQALEPFLRVDAGQPAKPPA